VRQAAPPLDIREPPVGQREGGVEANGSLVVALRQRPGVPGEGRLALEEGLERGQRHAREAAGLEPSVRRRRDDAEHRETERVAERGKITRRCPHLGQGATGAGRVVEREPNAQRAVRPAVRHTMRDPVGPQGACGGEAIGRPVRARLLFPPSIHLTARRELQARHFLEPELDQVRQVLSERVE
jgi:hypothetical protein